MQIVITSIVWLILGCIFYVLFKQGCKMKYLLIDSKGNMSRRKRMNLKQMQKFVGGYIERVGDIICNEEGKFLNLPRNIVYPRFVGNIIEVSDRIN